MDKATRPAAKPGAFIKNALIPLAMAVVFALIFYTCNTPLGPAVGSDNAMYLTMGTALSKGYAPYSEIFDHKGPLLFILQMIPQLFTDGYSTLCVFIQEVLFLWASLLVIGHIAKRAGALPMLVQLIYLAVFAPVLDGANLTEEYTNLFTLIGIATILSVFDSGDGLGGDDAGKLLLPAGVMGLMAMLAFMTRANNAMVLCAAVGALALSLLFARRFAALGRCILGFLLGCAAGALPIIAWLYGHGAISDAIYGAITHNMMYAETNGMSRVHSLFFTSYGHYALFLAALSCLGAAAYYIRTRRMAPALAMVFGAAGGGLAAFISHKFYNHYLMLGVPMAVLGAAQMLALVRDKQPDALRLSQCVAAALCGAALTSTGMSANALRETDYAAMQALTPDAIALYDQVPETDRDRFLAYRVEPKWYVATKALPCMRFYFLQEILADADPAVMDEIVSEFESDPPLWVVLFYNRPFSPPYDVRVQEIFDTRYEFVDAKGQYQLLRLKEAE